MDTADTLNNFFCFLLLSFVSINYWIWTKISYVSCNCNASDNADPFSATFNHDAFLVQSFQFRSIRIIYIRNHERGLDCLHEGNQALDLVVKFMVTKCLQRYKLLVGCRLKFGYLHRHLLEACLRSVPSRCT